MNETAANPIIVALLFVLRCLVPLIILFGISYVLRRLGLVTIDATEPFEEDVDDDDDDESPSNTQES